MGKVDEASIIELLKLGWNNEMIADKLGIGPERARRVRKKNGFPASSMKRERGERIGEQKGALVYAVQDKRPVVVPPHRAGARAMPTFDGNTKCLTCVYRTCVWPNTVCGYLLAEGRSRWHSQKVPFGEACTLYMEGDPEDIEWKTM